MDDREWHRLVKEGEDAGWKLVWERVVEPESKSVRSAEMMERFSLTAGDLMGMLYDEMIGKGKIDLYRGEGSFEGWLKRYVRGYVLNADPNKHGEISIEGAHPDAEGEGEAMADDAVFLPPALERRPGEVLHPPAEDALLPVERGDKGFPRRLVRRKRRPDIFAFRQVYARKLAELGGRQKKIEFVSVFSRRSA